MPQKIPRQGIFLVSHLEDVMKRISKNPIPQKMDKLL